MVPTTDVILLASGCLCLARPKSAVEGGTENVAFTLPFCLVQFIYKFSHAKNITEMSNSLQSNKFYTEKHVKLHEWVTSMENHEACFLRSQVD